MSEAVLAMRLHLPGHSVEFRGKGNTRVSPPWMGGSEGVAAVEIAPEIGARGEFFQRRGRRVGGCPRREERRGRGNH